jgi:type II secretory pathway pseudopilin PulG
MTRTRDARGFTLIEVLLVCIVGMVIFLATMTAFTSFYRDNRAAETQRDNVEEARVALDVVARQLRNLANPSGANPTITRAADYDFIFQTSDPAKTWVRYCLDTTSAGSSTGQAKLWSAESRAASPPPAMTGTCGAAGTGVTWRIVTQNVSNKAGGMDRPVFSYACVSGSPVTCPASATEYPKITMVGAQLYVDAKPNDSVREMQVSTGVFLRNQNQAPVASVTGPVTVGTHKVFLNGTGSSDPEGRTLDYHWYLDTTPPNPFPCSAPPQDNWSGPTFTQDFGATATVGAQHNVWLVVCDPGGLSNVNGPTAVPVP